METLSFLTIVRRFVLVLAMLWISAAAQAADHMVNGTPANASPIDSLDAMMDKVFPFIKIIQNSSFVAGDYHIHLSRTEMRIDHMTLQTTAPISKRTCMVGLTYAAPVAFFGARLDVPLMASKNLFDTSAWTRASAGDYVLHFSEHPEVEHPALMLTLTARIF